MLSSPVRTRILDAARDIIDTKGLGELTQPKVARAAGVRQSHLTYYFPRRTDLLSALLDHSHHTAGHAEAEADFLAHLVRLLFEPQRTRLFLAVVVETSETPEGRSATAAHMAHFAAHLASHFGRDLNDPHLLALVAELRGLSLQNLVAPVTAEMGRALISAAMQRQGFDIASAGAR